MKTFSKATIKYFFARNESAVYEIYMETYRLLFHIAYSMLNSREDAEDIVMQTYEKAMNSDSTKIKNSNSFVSYLASICKNTSLDYLKKNKNVVDLEIDEERMANNDQYNTLILDLKKILSKDQFDIFFYKEYYGLPFKEISPLVDKSVARCRSILFEAKKILRDNKELFL